MINQDKTENAVTIIDNRDKKGRFAAGNTHAINATRARKQTLILKQFMTLEEFVEINAKAISLAKSGDTKMIELFLKPLIPQRSDSTIYCDGWDKGTTRERLQSIIDHVNAGVLTPSEGERLSNIVDKYTRSVEMIDLSNKIDSLIDEKERRESKNV